MAQAPAAPVSPSEKATPAPDKAEKAPGAFKTISEAAQLLDVPQHVLRFWESRFPQIKPLKRSGGRRYYRPEDIDILNKIKFLLYKQGFTINGAKKAFAGTEVLEAPLAGKDRAVPVIAQPGEPSVPALTVEQKEELRLLRDGLSSMRDRLRQALF